MVKKKVRNTRLSTWYVVQRRKFALKIVSQEVDFFFVLLRKLEMATLEEMCVSPFINESL